MVGGYLGVLDSVDMEKTQSFVFPCSKEHFRVSVKAKVLQNCLLLGNLVRILQPRDIERVRSERVVASLERGDSAEAGSRFFGFHSTCVSM